MIFRRFGAREARLAEEWGAEVVSRHAWALGAPVGTGVSGSSWIVRDDGIRGIAKPAFQEAQIANAANERIAAELARFLDVPVPPVQLWRNPDDGALYGLSAFPFAEPITWGQAAPFLTPRYLQNALHMIAAGYVFHTWIADTDHAAHPGNLLVDANSSEDQPGIAFIDHAYSLAAFWNEASPRCQPPPVYYVERHHLSDRVIAAFVGRIMRLPLAQVWAVVDAVPSDFLPPEKAALTKRCLARRRDELAGAFGVA